MIYILISTYCMLVLSLTIPRFLVLAVHQV